MKNLTIVIGVIGENLKNGVVFSQFPESGKHPKEQIEWVNRFISSEDFPDMDRVIGTFSDYIIREINYLIMIGKLSPDKVIAIDENGYRLKVDEIGFEVPSIDETIDNQNDRVEEAYYNLKYPDNEENED